MEAVWSLTESEVNNLFDVPGMEIDNSLNILYQQPSSIDMSSSPIDLISNLSGESSDSDSSNWSDYYSSSSQTSSPSMSPSSHSFTTLPIQDECLLSLYSSPNDCGILNSFAYPPTVQDMKLKSAITKVTNDQNESNSKRKKGMNTTKKKRITTKKQTTTTKSRVKKEKEEEENNSGSNNFDSSSYDCNSSLIFSRAQLLKMTVDELDDRVRVVEEVRSLTSEEKKEIKKQRRMIKNRESAYASRVRQKQLVENMEEELNEIKKENEQLSKRVEDLEKENNQLKARLAAKENIGNSFSSTSSSLASFLSIGSPSLKSSSSNIGMMDNVMQTSTSLFIVLLSFGLLFAQIQPDMLSQTTFPKFNAFPTNYNNQNNGELSPRPGHVIPISSNHYKGSSSSILNANLQAIGSITRGLLTVDEIIVEKEIIGKTSSKINDNDIITFSINNTCSSSSFIENNNNIIDMDDSINENNDCLNIEENNGIKIDNSKCNVLVH